MPTRIEWCDETFNPWWGCERVSPACAHCYADDTARFRTPDLDLWGAGHEFRFFADEHWREPLRWARTLPGRLGRRPIVFCASMADVFEERPELISSRERLLDLIAATPELDWLVLTKRPELVVAMLDDLDRSLPPNVWLGVSIENARYTWRADALRQIPATVRFISAEPLLGSLYVESDCLACRDGVRRELVWGTTDTYVHWYGDTCAPCTSKRAPLDLAGIDWVIVGGESGPKARPFHLEHARELIRACAATPPDYTPGPYIFVKQLGARPVRTIKRYDLDGRITLVDEPLKLRDRKGGNPDEWPPDLRIREHPTPIVVVGDAA